MAESQTLPYVNRKENFAFSWKIVVWFFIQEKRLLNSQISSLRHAMKIFGRRSSQYFSVTVWYLKPKETNVEFFFRWFEHNPFSLSARGVLTILLNFQVMISNCFDFTEFLDDNFDIWFRYKIFSLMQRWPKWNPALIFWWVDFTQRAF